jgi:hypothetical protein
MNVEKNFSVYVGGNVTGNAIAVGAGAQAIGTIAQNDRQQIADLLEQLRREVHKASLPASAKDGLEAQAIPEMHKALQTDQPTSGLEQGLRTTNLLLQGAGAVAKDVSGIVDVVHKIAQYSGIAIKTVAPFVAGLL